MRISDWRSDVCSSDLVAAPHHALRARSPSPRLRRREDKRQLPAPKRPSQKQVFAEEGARSAVIHAAGLRQAHSDGLSCKYEELQLVVYGKSVSERVDLGCRCITKQKNKKKNKK